MTQVEIKRNLKTLAEENGEDVIRITFQKTDDYTIATMFTIDKQYDTILKRTYYSNKKSKKLNRLDNLSGLMVLRKDYVSEEGV